MRGEDDGLSSRLGPVEIDWPATVGYFGGIALAVALEVIEPPLGLFIAVVPFIKLFKRRDAPLPARVVSHLLEGAAKPVGGDAQSTIRVANADNPEDQARSGSRR